MDPEDRPDEGRLLQDNPRIGSREVSERVTAFVRRCGYQGMREPTALLVSVPKLVIVAMSSAKRYLCVTRLTQSVQSAAPSPDIRTSQPHSL
jgi:hypothetical protein